MSPAGSSCVLYGVFCLIALFPADQNCREYLNFSWFLTSRKVVKKFKMAYFGMNALNSLLAYLHYACIQRFLWLSTLNKKSLCSLDLPLLFNYVRLRT